MALRLGVIGGGINSAVGRAHYCASRMDGYFNWVVGQFSRTQAANHASARYYSAAVADSIDAVLAADIDAVLLLTPTPQHAEQVRRAAAAGVPVICEKPLAASLPELDTIDALTQYVAVTFNYTGYPMVRELREVIAAGGIGRVLHVDAIMPQETYLLAGQTPQEWRCHDGRIPAIYLDLGTHLHHLVDYVLSGNQPQRVQAMHRFDSTYSVVDDVRALVQYDRGVTVHYWFSKTALGHRNGLSIRVYGENGSLCWTQTDPDKLELALDTGDKATLDYRWSLALESNKPRYQRFKPGHPTGYIEALANTYADIYSQLDLRRSGVDARDLTPNVAGYDVSYAGIKLMDAMTRAAENAKCMTIPI